jgi:lipoate-protein ligase A
MRWTLLIDHPRPGRDNMAIDTALLDLADGEGAAYLRLYQWKPHCLSFGRHEPALRRYDRARIAELGIECVRRPTGGRAVWHARELTYAVAAPLAEFGGLREAYAAIHGVLAAALRSLGASPQLAPRASPQLGLAAGPCFMAPVGGEVLIGGKKVVGSAQLRQNAAFLQHGSLLLDDDQNLVRSLARLPQAGSAEAPLSRLLGRPVTFDQMALAIKATAAGMWNHVTELAELPRSLHERARIHSDRFGSEAWTWQR